MRIKREALVGNLTTQAAIFSPRIWDGEANSWVTTEEVQVSSAAIDPSLTNLSGFLAAQFNQPSRSEACGNHWN